MKCLFVSARVNRKYQSPSIVPDTVKHHKNSRDHRSVALGIFGCRLICLQNGCFDINIMTQTPKQKED